MHRWRLTPSDQMWTRTELFKPEYVNHLGYSLTCRFWLMRSGPALRTCKDTLLFRGEEQRQHPLRAGWKYRSSAIPRPTHKISVRSWWTRPPSDSYAHSSFRSIGMKMPSLLIVTNLSYLAQNFSGFSTDSLLSGETPQSQTNQGVS